MRSLSLLLLLAAVCLLAVSSCLVSAQGPDPLEFLVVTCVGCKAGIHPIISNNGTVNPEWTTLTPYLTRDFEYPTYSLSFATGAPAGLSQDYRIDYQSVIAVTGTLASCSLIHACMPAFPLLGRSTEDSVATTSMGFEESTVFTQQATPTSSRTLCRKDGQIDMLMTLTLTKAGVRTHQLGWTFRKRCTVPLIQIGTTPYDFDVANGTAAAAEFGNWVVQGPVLSLYMYLLNPVAAPGTIATEAPFTLSFTTSGMNQQLTIGTWTYNSTDPLSGNPGVYVLQDASHPIGQLDIPFICQQPQSYQTVTVTLGESHHTRVQAGLAPTV
jgi:hypothetical protein